MILRNFERQPVRAVVSVIGIAFALAVLVVGLAFLDVMDALIDEQFTLRHATGRDAHLRGAASRRGIHDVAHLPGVLAVEPMRLSPVRLRAGHRSRTLASPACREARAEPVIDRAARRGHASGRWPGSLAGRSATASASRRATSAGRGAGGTPAGRDVPIVAPRRRQLGLQAYMRIDALAACCARTPRFRACATIDPARDDRFYAAAEVDCRRSRACRCASAMLQNFRYTMAEHMNLSIFINVLFAASSPSASSTTPPACRCPNAAASWPAFASSASPARKSRILLGELAVITLLAFPSVFSSVRLWRADPRCVQQRGLPHVLRHDARRRSPGPV